jgi:hypothetical protein
LAIILRGLGFCVTAQFLSGLIDDKRKWRKYLDFSDMSAVFRATRDLLGIGRKKFGSRLIIPLPEYPSVMNADWSQGEFVRRELWWEAKRRYKYQRTRRPAQAHASRAGKATYNPHLTWMPWLAKWTFSETNMRAGVQQSPESVLGGRLINRPVDPI